MKDDFENMDSVEDMLKYIADKSGEEDVIEKKDNTLLSELQMLQVQSFLKFFGVCQEFTDAQKSELETCTAAYNDNKNSSFMRQSALAHVCELFFPEEEKKPGKEIARKNDSKVFQTPCEDCQTSPTHLVQFKQDNRVEEHFLCENCEEAAKAGEEDVE